MGQNKLSRESINRANDKVYQEHPEFNGVSPKVLSEGNNFILSYETKMKTEDGLSLKMMLKASINIDGKILKISVSK